MVIDICDMSEPQTMGTPLADGVLYCDASRCLFKKKKKKKKLK